MATKGPLAGVRIVEFQSIGPAPFGVMLLADMGAEVLRICRPRAPWPDIPIVSRGRHSVSLDLKQKADKAIALDALSRADVLVEGFRPGVMERLGLGPELMEHHPRLIYARSTGWGQFGSLAHRAGHDINFIALSGLLAALRPAGEQPVPPLNIIGDYAGGALYLALGVVMALYEREKSDSGQLIDAAVVDGCASLLAPLLGMQAAGVLPQDPGSGVLSGNAPYYRTYRCSDGCFIAVGALEPEFRRVFADCLELEPSLLDGDPALASEFLEKLFASRPRQDWVRLFGDTDACVTPVLSFQEAAAHPHEQRRNNFVRHGEGIQPSVAPRFSRTPGEIGHDGEGKDLIKQWRETPR